MSHPAEEPSIQIHTFHNDRAIPRYQHQDGRRGKRYLMAIYLHCGLINQE